MQYLIYTHGGSGNHGCEALARTILDILGRNKQAGDVLCLASYRMVEDIKYLSDKKDVTFLAYRHYDRTCVLRILSALLNRLGVRRQNWYYRISDQELIEFASPKTVAISIGGDNYCYGAPYGIYETNRRLRMKGVKSVLLGCSIDEAALTQEMLLDLKGYDLIHVRESITYETLRAKGLDNLALFPDTAFSLPQTDCSDAFFESEEVIGINSSPLLLKHAADPDMIMRNFNRLIAWILGNTSARVALIPHVEWPGNQDMVTLRQIQSFFPSERVKLFPNGSCLVQKGIIGRCSFLVAARTHASIAGYSAGVPTLAVGYSVKARGIAKDLFGSYEGYVIPVQRMAREDDLMLGFIPLYNRKAEIRSHLQTMMPVYRRQLHQLEETLCKVISR